MEGPRSLSPLKSGAAYQAGRLAAPSAVIDCPPSSHPES